MAVEVVKPGVANAKAVQALRDVELQLRAADKSEKDKADAKNALEEFIYAMREKLEGELAPYIEEAANETFRAKLTEMEDWIYDDGEDVAKSVYIAKLGELTAVGNPVQSLFQEAQTRPAAVEAFQKAIVIARKFLDDHGKGLDIYAHLTDEEVAKVKTAVDEKSAWLDGNVAKQAALKQTEPVAALTSQYKQEHALFDKAVNPIMTKPAPKVEPPKAEEKPAEGEAPAAGDAPAEGEAPAAEGDK